MSRREWSSVYCDGDKASSAVLSWFKPYVPGSWGPPIAADIQTEIETDRETAMRALFRLADGTLKEAIRRRSRNAVTVTTRPASPAICNTPSARHAIAKREGVPA